MMSFSTNWSYVYVAYIYNVTNGSNHWMLRQPDQVSITDTMARGTRGSICGNQ